MRPPLSAESAKPVAEMLREIAKRVREQKAADVTDLLYSGLAFGMITGDEDGKNIPAFCEGLDDSFEGFAGFCERLADKAEQVEAV